MATSFGLCMTSSGENIYKNLNAGVYIYLKIFWPDDGLRRPKLVAII